MCDEESSGIGELVPDNVIIYRGCSRSNFLTPSRDAATEIAFQKPPKDKDGLSLALTAADSVNGLNRNYGVIRITVGAIHGLNAGLEVRRDTTDPTHVLIRNLPCMHRDDQEKERALKLSAELAVAAEIESAKPIPTPPPITTQGTA